MSNTGTFRVLLRALLGSFAIVAIALAAGSYLQRVAPTLIDEEFLGSNLGFFLLINVNIILALVLGFLTVKNLVKLILDRRRNILGSRLRSRLVVAFVGLALVPTVLLFLVAKGMVSSLFQGWFQPQVEASIEGALTIAQHYYENAETQLRGSVSGTVKELEPTLSTLLKNRSASRVEGQPLEVTVRREALERFLERQLAAEGLGELALIDAEGNAIARVASVEVASQPTPNLNNAAVKESASRVIVRADRGSQGELLRLYSPIDAPVGALLSRIFDGSPTTLQSSPDYRLIAGLWIPPKVQSALASVVNSNEDYKELGIYRRPLASSYLLALIVVTVMIVFAAVWVGFYLARTLTVPIQLLAAGTEEVAQGNLDHRIPEVGDDELSVLVRRFNRMTADLKQTGGELEQRRRYIEAILANIDIGVISVDIESKVTTFNVAAAGMLGVEPFDRARRNKELVRLLPPELGKKALELMNELYTSSDKLVTAEMSLYVTGETRHLQATATKLVDEHGKVLGAVILLDDLTELISAQRMSAWREVARRIAHEIKNPLTPIQLSAQRMQRRLSAGSEQALVGDERSIVAECTETIVNQVELLRSLVNEFSRFARMPKSEPRPTDLNLLIRETGRIYSEAHPKITLRLELEEALPLVDLDRDQISRVLLNLLDNAVASIEEFQERAPAATGEITVTTVLDETLGVVTLSVVDNGVGITDADKPRLFEPYFSRKKGGTGLGLAIVSSIVSDHNGFIRVRDNYPRGAILLVEFPLHHTAISSVNTPRRAVG